MANKTHIGCKDVGLLSSVAMLAMVEDLPPSAVNVSHLGQTNHRFPLP